MRESRGQDKVGKNKLIQGGAIPDSTPESESGEGSLPAISKELRAYLQSTQKLREQLQQQVVVSPELLRRTFTR